MARARATSRTPWTWTGLGVVAGTLIGVSSFAPAQWLSSRVEAASGGQLQLRAAQGSIWDGSAQLALSGGAGSSDVMGLPGRLRWRLRPRWNGLGVDLSADCCTTEPVQLQFSGLQLRVADSQSHWPAAMLSGLGTPWNTLQLQGQLQLRTQGLGLQWQAGQLRLQGQVQLDALDMSSRLSTLAPLGSYRLQVQGGDGIGLQLQTLAGALQLSGQGQWLGQRLRFRGEASAEPQKMDALSNLLNIIGRRNGARSLISVG